jgi:cytochrome P450
MAAPSASAPQGFPNPFQNPALREDPYPLYAMLRGNNPVFRPPLPLPDPGAGVTLLFGFAEVEQMLRHPKASVDRLRADIVQQFRDLVPADMLGEGGRLRSMLMLDGADHGRVRGLVNKAFTPRRVAKLSDRIQQIVDDLLDAALEGGRMDLMPEFAEPLPAIVIAELLGVPSEDHRQFKEWAKTLVNSIGEAGPLQRGPEFEQTLDALVDYLGGVIALRRKAPGDDLISGMIAAQESRDALSHQELLSNSLLLLLAGHETTTNLIGNGTLALLRHRDQWEGLLARPERLEPAIEELLRYDSPVQATVRVPTEDMELSGVAVPARSLVVCVIGSANRDPRVFERPDELDVTRENVRHLSFGFGEHFCLGAGLARLEARLAFRALLDRAPGLELTGEEVKRRPNLLLRGLQSLPVAVG